MLAIWGWRRQFQSKLSICGRLNIRSNELPPRVTVAFNESGGAPVPEFSQDSWTDFSVGTLSTNRKWVNSSCQPLERVSHVTHVAGALEVLRTGSIQPRLIYDESRLNTKRVLVVWVSPNDWSNAGGFRYGNISFELDWTRLVEDKRFYWVGVMRYQPRACRILVTDKNRDEKLLPYVASEGDGPWWHNETAQTHHWNGDYCLELMIECEISLSDVTSLRFVTHCSATIISPL